MFFDSISVADLRATKWSGTGIVVCLERRANDLHYGPADATATQSSFASVKSRMVYLSGDGLPRSSWKKAIKWM